MAEAPNDAGLFSGAKLVIDGQDVGVRWCSLHAIIEQVKFNFGLSLVLEENGFTLRIDHKTIVDWFCLCWGEPCVSVMESEGKSKVGMFRWWVTA